MVRPTLALILLTSAFLLLPACASNSLDDQTVKPTLAILTFENKANFPRNWDLGNGTRDILVDRLMKTQRYQLLERPDIGAVVKEINLQHSGMTREQDRVKPGGLKNAQYLIKGTITDFGHVVGGQLNGGTPRFSIFGGGSCAVMGMTLYVIRVESGEILASERIQETVSSGAVDFNGKYKDITFGGALFFKTPLGQATAHAMDRAVEKITKVIAAQAWQPKVAAIQPDGSVILNGGENRGIAVGMTFDVIELGEPVTDPETGDVICQRPAKLLGRLVVRQVLPTYAVAAATYGDPQTLPVGAVCRRTK